MPLRLKLRERHISRLANKRRIRYNRWHGTTIPSCGERPYGNSAGSQAVLAPFWIGDERRNHTSTAAPRK